MDPHQLFCLVRPTNNFAMGGTPMHLARILLQDGHSLPKHLFLDVMVEKTQLLIQFINNHLRPLPNSKLRRNYCCYSSL